MRNILLFSVLLFSSCNDLFDWGATTSNCDEICTLYQVVRTEVMKSYGLNYSNFPLESEYRKHVKGENSRFKIDSYFRIINKDNDTLKHTFTCKVFYDKSIIGYK